MPITRAQYVTLVQAQFIDASLYTFGDTGSTLLTYADDLLNRNDVSFGGGISASRFSSGGPGDLPYVELTNSTYIFPPDAAFNSVWTIEAWFNDPIVGDIIFRRVDGGATGGVQVFYAGYSVGVANFEILQADGTLVEVAEVDINPATAGWFQLTMTGVYEDLGSGYGQWRTKIYCNGVQKWETVVPTVEFGVLVDAYAIWNEGSIRPLALCYFNGDAAETETTILARYTAVTAGDAPSGGTGNSRNTRRRQAMSEAQGEAVTFEFNTDDASTAVTMTIKDANQVTRTLQTWERLIIDAIQGTVAAAVTRFDIFDDKNNNGSVQAGELIMSAAGVFGSFDGGPEGFSVTTGNTPKGIATGAGAIRVTGSARIIAGQSRGVRPAWKGSLVPGQ